MNKKTVRAPKRRKRNMAIIDQNSKPSRQYNQQPT